MKPDLNLNDEQTAEQLFDDGWRTTSNRYRMVARVPPGYTAREAMRKIGDSMADRTYTTRRNPEPRLIHSEDSLYDQWCRGYAQHYCATKRSRYGDPAVFGNVRLTGVLRDRDYRALKRVQRARGYRW